MSTAPSLATRHSDLTQAVILDAAVAQLEQAPLSELSVRAVARLAGISERTVFRYFATRETLLDALAGEVRRRIAAPPVPVDIAGLLAYPGALYACFEARAGLTRTALYSELYDRIRVAAQERARRVSALIERAAPRRAPAERRLAAASISYQLVATTWHYYRHHFELSLDDSVRCARQVIAQGLEGLGVAPPAARRAPQRSRAAARPRAG